MKKTMRKMLCLLLVILAFVNISSPAMALSGNTTTKSSNGSFTDKDGISYKYTCTLSASTSKATASINYSGISLVSCTAAVIWRDSDGGPHWIDAFDSDYYYASATVSSSVYTFTEAYGRYVILGTALPELALL